MLLEDLQVSAVSKLELIKSRYANFESEKELREHLIKEGFDVFPWQDSPGALYSPHQHPHDEFIVIHSGSLIFKAKGNDFRLEPGDMLVLPEGTIHSAQNDQAVTVRYFICSR